MIDLSPIPSPTPSVTPAPAAGGKGAKAFGQTLGAFLDASDAASATAVTERQALADDGKGLPVAAGQDDDQQDADDAATSSWLPGFILQAPPPADPSAHGDAQTADTLPGDVAETSTAVAVTAAVQPRVADTAWASAPPLGGATPLSFPPVARAAFRVPAEPPGQPSPAAPPAAGVAMPAAFAPLSTDGGVVSVTGGVAQVGQDAAAAISSAPKPTNDAPRPTVADSSPPTPTPVDPASRTIAVSAVAQPAGQVFAAAIAAATSWRTRSTRVGEQQPIDLATSGMTTPAATVDRTIVQATGDAQNAALDLTRDSGLQHMIDRIETLRDDADSRDTRIRLMPDALGSVDVAVRQEGTRVHVRFTAEQDATRALIADAQPRLTELAAARGVRIGDTSVGTGSGGSATPQQPHTQANPRFARAPVAVASDTDSPTTDHRLA